MRGRSCLLLAVLLAGCGGESSSSGQGGAGGGVACQEGEVPTGDGCVPYGVPPSACAAGFRWEAGACLPVLPPEPCGPGTLALPGEEACRPVAPCDGDVWTKLPPGIGVTWVDQSYAGVSDGSVAQPWKTIGQGVTAALPGTVVAVESGTYSEDVLLFEKAVQVWGRCPAEVTIVGGGTQIAPLIIVNEGSGSEVHDVGISGSGLGVAVSNATAVASRIWVHDLPDIGIDVEDQVGAAELTVADSLVEAVARHGAFVFGATLALERSVIRDVGPVEAALLNGRGVTAESNPATGMRSSVAMSSVLVERVREAGVVASGADVSLVASIVRSLEPAAVMPPSYGYGLAIQNGLQNAPSTGTLSTSLVDGAREFGIYVSNAQVGIDATSILTTLGSDAGEFGDGIATTGVAALAKTTVGASFVGDHQRAGITAFGGVVELAGVTSSCNPIDLDAEPDPVSLEQGSIVDMGDNRCGCGEDLGDCKVSSVMLAPPEPL